MQGWDADPGWPCSAVISCRGVPHVHRTHCRSTLRFCLSRPHRAQVSITTCTRCPKSLRHQRARFLVFRRWARFSLYSCGDLLPFPFLKCIGRIQPCTKHKSRKRGLIFFGVFFCLFGWFLSDHLLLQFSFVCRSFGLKASLLNWDCPLTAQGWHFEACFSYSPLGNILLRATEV